MEFERTLFRVHERFLSLRSVTKTVEVCYKLSIILVLVTIPFFLYGNSVYTNKSPCLQPYLNQYYYLNTTNETNITIPEGKTIINKDHLVRIRIVDKYDSSVDLEESGDLYAYFEFSPMYHIVLLPQEFRAIHNVTTHNITLDVSCYQTGILSRITNYILDFENIVINEIVASFDGFDRIVRNEKTKELWTFSDQEIKDHEEYYGIISHFIWRCFGILRLAFGLFLVSNITSIYNKMTIICAPIFILVSYRMCTHPSHEQATRMNIFKAFPWIGMYLYTLNNNGRIKDRYIVMAFLAMIVVFYCLYLAALIFWNTILFSKSFPKGLDENFYGFVALIEFLALLFVRTRSTLKYFPQLAVISMLMFLYYVQNTPYGFYNLALFIMNWTVVGFFCYFMRNFEIPACNWNPSYHYTPSIDQPRTLFFPIFSLGWYHDLPQFWTMFYPLFGRSHFSNNELAMVNRNYPLLMSNLEAASQGRRLDDINAEGADGNNRPPEGPSSAFNIHNLGDNNPPDQGQIGFGLGAGNNQNNQGNNGARNNRGNVNLLGGGQNDRSNNSSTEHNLLDNNGSEIALDIQGEHGEDHRNTNLIIEE